MSRFTFSFTLGFPFSFPGCSFRFPGFSFTLYFSFSFPSLSLMLGFYFGFPIFSFMLSFDLRDFSLILGFSLLLFLLSSLFCCLSSSSKRYCSFMNPRNGWSLYPSWAPIAIHFSMSVTHAMVLSSDTANASPFTMWLNHNALSITMHIFIGPDTMHSLT